MYTLVLMTAMSTAPATPQFDGYFRDFFRGSCHGSCTGKDSRSASGSSCQGSSCSGGGLFHGRIRNFFAGLFDGGSCQGSCHGSCNGRQPPPRAPLPVDPAFVHGGCTGSAPIVYGGCNGGCVGSAPLYLGSCFGSTPNYSCYGSSCTGGFGIPPMSVPSVPYDYAQPTPVGFGAAGCDCLTGGTSMPPLGNVIPGGTVPGLPGLGSPVSPDGFPPTYPTIPSPGVPTPPRTMPDDFDNPAQPTPAEGRSGYKLPLDDDTTRGRVQVKVPADAKLFVEGRELSVTDGERTFVTPPLPADREAVYTFKVEYTRGGDTLSLSRKVRVRANATTVVDFADLSGTSVKSLPPVSKEAVTPPAEVQQFDSRTTNKPVSLKTEDVPTLTPPPGLNVAKITVKLPQGATLYVNGGKNERTELVREFTTPTLTPGKGYQYTMRAELMRNGLPEYQESKVDFKAGDTLTVDFTSLADTPDDRRASK